MLAKTGGGNFTAITNNDDDLDVLLAPSQFRLQLEAEQSKQTTILWNDAGYWFVILLLPLAVLAFQRGRFIR